MKIINIFNSGLYPNRAIALTEDGEVLIGEYTITDTDGVWHIVDKITWNKLYTNEQN